MNDHESPKDKECNMKGCIINSDKVSLEDVFDCINDFAEYNCLITNIECYPLDGEIAAIFVMNIAGLRVKNCYDY